MRNVADDPFYMPHTSMLLAKTCIDCGRFLGAQRFWRNGKDGYRPDCSRCAKRRLAIDRGSAWRIPAGGILLAKTCVDCGKLLGPQQFWGNGKASRVSACARCMKGRKYRYHQQQRSAA
jgi:hypothetical protein